MMAERELEFDPSGWAADTPRRGVVGVVARRDRLLVIQRSQHVEAPGKFCFPGGAIERGESEADALRREFLEELSAAVEPRCCLWTSVTPWNVQLRWWHATLDRRAALRANPAEVASAHWLTIDEMLRLDDLLESNRQFLAAWARNEFTLPDLRC